MTRTFLVALDLSPSSDLPTIAADIQDELSESGFTVLSVSPWGQPAASVSAFDELPPLPPSPLLGLSR